MDNKYLEKVANAYRDYLTGKGVDLKGVTNQAIRAAYGSGDANTAISTGAKRAITKETPTGFLGMGKSRVEEVAPAKHGIKLTPENTGKVAGKRGSGVRFTGDVLAKGDLKSRLSAYKAAKATAAPNKYIGAMNKSTSLLKRHPLLSAGAALGVGMGIGRILPKSSSAQIEQYQGPYYG